MLNKLTKIAFYLPNAESGGAEKMIIAMANELALKDYNVMLILGRAEGDFLDCINEHVIVKVIGVSSILKSMVKLYKIISKESPNILCVTKIHINALVSLFTPFLNNTKIVLREANTPSVEYYHAGLYVKIIMSLGKLTYRLSHKYIAVSNGVADDMAYFYGLKKSKILTIYNPIISSEFFRQSKENVFHPFFEEQKKSPAIYTFLAVGRLMPQKDYPTLIESFNQAYKINNNIRLIILGRIEENNLDFTIVNSKIKDNNLASVIDFVGFVQNPFKYLSKANCFIQTSLFEGLPGTLVQALGLRKDIIATNCKSGPEEVLDFGKYGALVEMGNIKQISEQIISYSNGKTNMKANDEFISQFTVDASTKQYELLFKSLISK